MEVCQQIFVGSGVTLRHLVHKTEWNLPEKVHKGRILGIHIKVDLPDCKTINFNTVQNYNLNFCLDKKHLSVRYREKTNMIKKRQKKTNHVTQQHCQTISLFHWDILK